MEISVINYMKNMALAIKIVEISISHHKIRTNFIFIPHSREGGVTPWCPITLISTTYISNTTQPSDFNRWSKEENQLKTIGNRSETLIESLIKNKVCWNKDDWIVVNCWGSTTWCRTTIPKVLVVLMGPLCINMDLNQHLN